MVLCVTMSFFACQKTQNEQEFMQKIAVGESFSLVISDDGELFGFGNSLYGVLANGVTSLSANATPISMNTYFDLHDNEVFKAVYAGDSHAFAITTEDRVFTWGNNFHGQTGIDPSEQLISIPRDITNSLNLHDEEKIIEWAQSSFHTIILTSENRILGWGNNIHDNLGVHDFDIVYEYGSYVPSALDLTPYFSLSFDETIVDIDTHHALTSQSRLFGWGGSIVPIDEQRNIRDITNQLNLQPGEVIEEILADSRILKTSEGRLFEIVYTITSHVPEVYYLRIHFTNDFDSTNLNIFFWYTNLIITDKNHQSWVSGTNRYGNLGSGYTIAIGDFSYDLVNHSSIRTLDEIYWEITWQKNEYPVAFAMSEVHTIMITNKYRIFVFGDNIFGQIGDGTTNAAYRPIMLDLE